MVIKPYAHPPDIFKGLANLEASIEWAKQPAPPTPKMPKADNIVNNMGWTNFIKTVLRESKLALLELKP